MPLEYHGSVEEYSQLPPSGRLKQWRWWFFIVLLAALAIGGYVIVRSVRSVSEGVPPQETVSQRVSESLSSFFMAAPLHAQSEDQGEAGRSAAQPQPFRAYIMMGTFVLLGVVTLVSLGVSLFSRNERSVTAASDILKTCIGFFIGAGTTYIG